MSAARIEGTYTALVTPFRGDLAIDWAAFDALVERQIAGGVKGLVPCGTTGESPTLSHDEHRAVVARAVKVAKGRAVVLAGAGSNSTQEAIGLALASESAGADAVMVVVPYYNKPTQDGLVAHFVAVAKSVKCPVVIYNIPGRSGVDLLPDAMGRIVDAAPNVVGTKEATGNVLRAQELVRRFGDRLTVMCGDDTLTLPMVAVGARGVISVTSNLLPGPVSRATELALTGDRETALRAHQALVPVHEAMFLESNPGPVKAALAMRELMQDTVRGPLVAASKKTREALSAVLATYDQDGASAPGAARSTLGERH